jgi:hypothetical protein
MAFLSPALSSSPSRVRSIVDFERAMIFLAEGRPSSSEAQGGDYGSALYAASVRGHEKVVGAGADVNAQGGDYGNALYAASVEGHEKVVE